MGRIKLTTLSDRGNEQLKREIIYKLSYLKKVILRKRIGELIQLFEDNASNFLSLFWMLTLMVMFFLVIIPTLTEVFVVQTFYLDIGVGLFSIPIITFIYYYSHNIEKARPQVQRELIIIQGYQKYSVAISLTWLILPFLFLILLASS